MRGQSRSVFRLSKTTVVDPRQTFQEIQIKLKSQTIQTGATKAIKDIRRATHKQYSAEEKVRMVLERLRGEYGIAELCRQKGSMRTPNYRWSKDFLEARKKL
ncbi:hypothetical protein A9Q83_04150 [Alphaproteobacteria bacterium 46_93_T64]|nr:hypothetical protein A9Q83_04150 [Alphaproteobacteria bacterium 46_93_T64]